MVWEVQKRPKLIGVSTLLILVPIVYKKVELNLVTYVRFSHKNFSNCFQVAMKSKTDWRFYYISFAIRHPFWFFWTEVPILSIKISMHLTIKKSKLKLKLQS